jgi:hypothetical protein
MRRHRGSPGNDPQLTGLPTRASYPNGDTSAPARESADQHQAAGQGASAAQSTAAPRMLVWATASRPRLDYASQGEQDGRQNQTQAHGDSLGNLVRLEFRPLCRDPHVDRCTPVPGARRAVLDLGLKGDLSRLRYHPCMVPPRWSDEQGRGRPLLFRRDQPEGGR